ncbi:mRNA-decapping enzyme 1B [Desmophyllum pertusum]|uniref:mRNA-decapping enzyme 1B n=1 Tax=Desmophyllum pertusum TaxID=174260 RepID=A0A9X0CES2_9CNID|nr:mRNA-decapping enzyme 1B [Desmophyllum pertusum]
MLHKLRFTSLTEINRLGRKQRLKGPYLFIVGSFLVVQKYHQLSSQTGAVASHAVASPAPAPEIPQESQANASEEKVDIMQLFAKAQERYNNQSKTSSSSAAASHTPNTPQKPPEIPQEQTEQQRKFLQQMQLQTEQVQKLFQTQDTQPKKQRAYSTPVPYLLGHVSSSPVGKGIPKEEGQENGVTPRAEGKSGKRKDKIKSLTLSDVKAPISSVGPGPITQTQDDSAIDAIRPGTQRKLFHNERMETKVTATLPTQSAPVAPQTTTVSHVKDSPQKPLQDQWVAAGSSLMSPMAFQPSGKVTILTPPPQPKQLPKMDIAPLTQEQLVQALTYLLKNDSEFVTKIHEAYFKSLQEKLPT